MERCIRRNANLEVTLNLEALRAPVQAPSSSTQKSEQQLIPHISDSYKCESMDWCRISGEVAVELQNKPRLPAGLLARDPP